MNLEKSLSTLITIWIISLAMLVGSSLGFFDNVISMTARVKAAFSQNINIKLTFFQDIWHTYKYINDVKKENEDLRKDLIIANGKVVNLQNELEAQNLYCKQLNSSFGSDYNLIPANVIFYNKDNYGVITLNKGEVDGVKNGDNVVLENYLIGRVVKVFKYTTFVRTLISSESKIAVISNRGTRGVLISSNGSELEVHEVLIDADVELGDTFVTLGVDDGIESGLYVGKVVKIDKKASDTTQIVHLDNEIQFNKLQKVFIIQNENFNN